MFCIGICDDDEGLCGELEKMLYDYGKENKLQMNIDIWYQGESLCRFLRENKKILDVVRAVTLKQDLVEVLKELDQDLVKGAVAGEKFEELFFANCKDEKIAEYVKTLR